MSRRALIWAVAAVAGFSVAASTAFGEISAKRATTSVTVGDDYYSCSKCTGSIPLNLKVKKGAKVKWVWLSSNRNTHNVKLTGTHPKGIKPKDFTSGSYATGASFTRKFKKPGKYGFVCTYHKPVMRLDVKVKK